MSIITSRQTVMTVIKQEQGNTIAFGNLEMRAFANIVINRYCEILHDVLFSTPSAIKLVHGK